MRRLVLRAVPPALGAGLVVYFAVHTWQGDHGVVALHDLKHRVAEAEQTLNTLQHQRHTLEHRVGLLDPRSLDPDMLEERARVVLNYSHPDDVMLVLAPDRTR